MLRSFDDSFLAHPERYLLLVTSVNYREFDMQPVKTFGGKASLTDPQAAPSYLEPVRAFLNTWCVPNDTRQPQDKLPSLLQNEAEWERMFEKALPREREDLQDLITVRDKIRQALQPECSGEIISELLDRFPVETRVTTSKTGVELQYRGRASAGIAGDMVARVVQSIGKEHWHRLKACPDCRWVFFDHTRNASKIWCVMIRRHPEGRSCGSIAKVKRYRDRKSRMTSVKIE